MRQSHLYLAIKEAKEEKNYSVEVCCTILGVSRAAYYRWLSGKKCSRELENEKIAEIMEQIHTENPDKGYRRIKDDLAHDFKLNVNEKRVLRICRTLDIKSTIKYANNGCTRQAANPQHIAKNWLNRQFHASMPNEKWLTDVTEFKWYEGVTVHKVYLSAILDLYDRRIVSFVIRDRNDNPLVFDTLDAAIKANPNAHPLFHSDRGFQYTNRVFYSKLQKAKMRQSMSRVAKCIDNGPMEGFWGILKRERYYGRRFTSREELVSMIENYITYYNNRRVQRNLGVLTPMEKHYSYLLAA
ncbi:MAG: IS3 family transposase [Oscillospiraceae bacterium]